jgi:hypothetical protein
MSEREARIRSVLVTYFPMFIATLSLVTSIYNGYLNGKFVDIIQRNVGRVEYMRTCRDVIDAYFQIKFRAGVLVESGADRRAAQIEAAGAVSKFAALGTYLANLRDERIRQRYTELSRQLERSVAEAAQASASDLPRIFDPADRLFAEMNADCVNSAKEAPM